MSHKRRYSPRFSHNVEGGLPHYMRALPFLPETEKLKLARRLHRQGLTLQEMVPQFPEYKSEAGLREFLRKNGIRPRSVGRGGPRQQTEETKRLRSESMKAYHAKNGGVHQNIWSKKDKEKMKVSFPAWHEEARKMRETGASNVEIAKKFNVTASRVSQVTNARWEEYAARDRSRITEYHTKRDEMRKEGAMPDRTFEKFKSKNPQETRDGVLIRCHRCNKSDLFMKPGRINQVHAARTFRERGWTVGGGPRADTCPECTDLARLQKRLKPIPHMEQSVEQPVEQKPFKLDDVFSTKTAPVAEPAAEPVKSEDTMTPMSKADKRIVISKLQDIYVDEIVGYSDDWDDDKVASDLGVPVQWVAEVREDAFGPNTNASKKQAAMTAEQVKTVEELAEQVKKAKAEVDEALAVCDAKVTAFDTTVEAFEKAYADLHNSVSMSKAA